MYKEIYLNANKPNTSLSKVFSSVLREFGDLFLEEVAHKLMLIRRIEHQIDLILEAPIPNRLTYRSNSDQTKELQK